jgi:hypothetical protein
MADDLHPREEDLEVCRDHLLDRDEPLAVGQLHEPREQRRHLDAREPARARRGIANERGEVQRQRGDVRERVGRVDRQRREDREHPLAEEHPEVLPIVVVEVLPIDDTEALFLERRPELLVPQDVRAGHGCGDALADPRELLVGRRSLRRGRSDARVALLLESGDADLEELVEVGAEDREELGPLEERL